MCVLILDYDTSCKGQYNSFYVDSNNFWIPIENWMKEEKKKLHWNEKEKWWNLLHMTIHICNALIETFNASTLDDP